MKYKNTNEEIINNLHGYPIRSIQVIKILNDSIGHHFFSRASMKFFNSKIESELLHDAYFITSERFDKTRSKMYTIRMVYLNGGIGKLGDFQQFASKKRAIDFLNEYLKMAC